MYRLFVGQVRILSRLRQPGQIFVRIQPVLNSCLDYAEHNRTAGCPLRSVGKQKDFPVNDKRLNTSLGPVVGDLQPSIFQIICQVRPLFF